MAKKPTTPDRPGLIGRLAYWLVVLGIWSAVALIGVVAWYAYDLPDVDGPGAPKPRPAVLIHYADGSPLARFGDLYGTEVALDELPPVMPQAVLAIEDRRFRWHFGIDLIGLVRAAVANFKAGRIVQGGSTITQQLAKNLFLKPERTIKRKAQEVLLALWLEAHFSKDEILTLYLNRVYLGAGTYGVEAAAQRYFGISARRLSLGQAALLAGLLKAPTRYAPTSSPRRARARAKVVLASMVRSGAITKAQATKAGQSLANLRARRQRPARARAGRYAADWIVEQVPGYSGHARRDIVVTTTLDAELQELAERVVESQLAADGKRLAASQAALVAMSRHGAVRALVGGRDYRLSQFNRASQARRQPGSTFKLFVYLAGLEAGLRPETQMHDEPLTVAGWSPRNYSGKYAGPVSLTQAFARSINTVAVKVAERAGRGRVVEAAARLGITSPLPAHPSTALGTVGISLLEMTAAYATVAAGGQGVWSHGISAIAEVGGGEIHRRTGSGPGRVMAPGVAADLDAMLRAAVERGGGRAARLDFATAGKTGTSQGHRDAWFIGYAGDLVAGVWVGNDDEKEMKRVTGSGLPARIWRAFMAKATVEGKGKSGHRPVPPTTVAPEAAGR
ncbi:MAG: PBP1A family penicillin-binding protein [Alphaproteobacteria bacterium]|jgi:penicillin-binding protein 1A|nr:PBP1A family penicillin-binding protein [Alphaproteobacteria bacterium]HJP21965.1 PBP1A family penicillin-binding protein [Alphaproteobacteria bacterium]